METCTLTLEVRGELGDSAVFDWEARDVLLVVAAWWVLLLSCYLGEVLGNKR